MQAPCGQRQESSSVVSVCGSISHLSAETTSLALCILQTFECLPGTRFWWHRRKNAAGRWRVVTTLSVWAGVGTAPGLVAPTPGLVRVSVFSPLPQQSPAPAPPSRHAPDLPCRSPHAPGQRPPMLSQREGQGQAARGSCELSKLILLLLLRWFPV